MAEAAKKKMGFVEQIKSLPANFWVAKQVLKTGGAPGTDKWVGTFFYNADRRTGKTFVPATDTLQLSIGSRVVTFGPDTLVKKNAAVMVGKKEEPDGSSFCMVRRGRHRLRRWTDPRPRTPSTQASPSSR